MSTEFHRILARQRIASWFFMFAHLMDCICRGEPHIEVCETKGFQVFGCYVGLFFIRRYCSTCGYLGDSK